MATLVIIMDIDTRGFYIYVMDKKNNNHCHDSQFVIPYF